MEPGVGDTSRRGNVSGVQLESYQEETLRALGGGTRGRRYLTPGQRLWCPVGDLSGEDHDFNFFNFFSLGGCWSETPWSIVDHPHSKLLPIFLGMFKVVHSLSIKYVLLTYHLTL